ncbi:MAG: phospholipid carrier-dependent glycosyltransferase [Elusimicrobia bacterium]|nr:phospholipid carrier-dependent glycosyltransferase [Elusimicrobiota bacterium]
MSDRWLTLAACFAGALGLHVCLQAFSLALAPGLVATALLVLVSFTVAGCGRLLLRRFEVRGLSESERTLVGATLGLGLLTQGLFMLGAVGLLRGWAVIALLGAFWVVGFTELADLWTSLGANRNILRERPLMTAALLALFAALYWLSWVPPHQYDSLVYHLPLAAGYARDGGLWNRPDLVFSNFPQNGEMLFTLAALLGSDTLSQLFGWLAAFLAAWWLFEMGKREAPIVVVLLACLLTVSHTGVMLLAPTAYVETHVMLWVTAAVMSFMRWRANAADHDAPRGWLALSALFAGLGFGTKYYAGITPALLALFLAWRLAESLRAGDTAAAAARRRDFLVFSGLAFAAGAPWLLKNLVVVGNPFFPFFYALFPARGTGWDGAAAAGYFKVLTEYGHPGGSFLRDLVAFPSLAASGSSRYGGGADILGGLGWAPLVAAFPLAVWAAWGRRTMGFLALYCAGHWLLWFSTGVVLRFLVPVVPLLSLLAANGAWLAWQRLGPGGRWALGAGGAVLLWTNLALFLHVNVLFGSFEVLTGAKSRRQFLEEKFDYYACAAATRELPPDAKVLVVGEQRGYFIERPHEVTTPMAPNRFVRLADAAPDPAGLGGSLREAGFTHLLSVPREGERLSGYGVFAFSPRGREAWEGLGRLLVPVFQSPGRCGLFALP